MPFRSITEESFVWKTRPHDDGEPARHVAELSDALGSTHVRANRWRYEPGAKGRRHVHALQEETFVVLSGTLTMYIGEPPERIEIGAGGAVNVSAGTPLQIVNHGSEDLVLHAYGYPPDGGATILESAV